MPRTVHPPEWPDKVMFAAMLQVMGGILGAAFAALQIAGLRVDREVMVHVGITPPVPALLLSLATFGLGLYAIRHQASVWVWISIATGILSVGMLGLVPLLSLVAVAFLLRSRAEGEETKHDDRIVHPSLWPDKALAASLLLFVAGGVALVQAYVIWRDVILLPAILRETPLALAALSLVAGLWCLLASFEVYRVRRPWVGHVGAALSLVSLGFLLVGPALGVAIIFLLRKAAGEKEFDGAATAA